MRIVQINSVPNLSTGTVMLENHKRYLAEGHESWRMWGRGREAENEYEFKFGTNLGVKIDVLETRIVGRPGFHSKAATKQLLAKLNEIKPDLVHLHNIHGYYVNVEMLFEWLSQNDCMVEWTLHDCWAFTGHCAYFTYAQCDQWKTGCACSNDCPQIRAYPKTFSSSSAKWSYARKKQVFSSLASDRMKLITPSRWLADLTRQSYLSKYPVEVIYNTIDSSVFHRRDSDFRSRYQLTGQYIVLGVASVWDDRKGLVDLLRLKEDLGKAVSVVLVGLSRKQLKMLPDGVLGFERTSSQQELAEIYSAVDLFFNPTREDNYPTTLLEAESCGCPVLTYDVGGCKEGISMKRSRAVASFEEAKSYVLEMLKEKNKEQFN